MSMDACFIYFYFKGKVVILLCFKKWKDINTHVFQFQNYDLENNWVILLCLKIIKERISLVNTLMINGPCKKNWNAPKTKAIDFFIIIKW